MELVLIITVTALAVMSIAPMLDRKFFRPYALLVVSLGIGFAFSFGVRGCCGGVSERRLEVQNAGLVFLSEALPGLTVGDVNIKSSAPRHGSGVDWVEASVDDGRIRLVATSIYRRDGKFLFFEKATVRTFTIVSPTVLEEPRNR